MRQSSRLRTILTCWATMAGLAAAAVLLPVCNEHPLVGFDAYVKKAVYQKSSVGGKTKFDILWLVDNSNSMCQEQDNLTRNFSAFIQQLSELKADFRMGVITTDVEDDAHDGQLQSSPATNLIDCIRANFDDESNYCRDDGDCGEFGCRCGIPHLQRCATDDDCPEDLPTCVRSSAQSELRFCSRSCNGDADGSCLEPASPNGVFFCRQSPDHPGQSHCLLRTCTASGDCPPPVLSHQGKVKYEYHCQPSAGEHGISYCRRLENFDFPCPLSGCPLGKACDGQTNTCPAYSICPAPTCDCPTRLDDVLEIDEMEGGQAELAETVRKFRCMATVGTTGSSVERGLEAIEHFIARDERKEKAKRFLRDEAHLVLVILADEDDCSGQENLPKQGLSSCVWFRDQLNPVSRYVNKVKELKKGEAKVVVASIVGEQDLRCVDSCAAPVPGWGSCVESLDCPAGQSCNPPNLCAERIFVFDENPTLREDPVHSCASPNGVAYAGNRYIAFTREFDSFGIILSICQESFAPALDKLADLIKIVGVNYCLSEPLNECRSDADCGEDEELGRASCRSYWAREWEMGVGRCVSEKGDVLESPASCRADAECGGQGARCDIRNICRWDDEHGGDPADLRIWFKPAGAEEGDYLEGRRWDFIPNGGNGCIGFIPAPGANDEVDIRYVSEIKL